MYVSLRMVKKVSQHQHGLLQQVHRRTTRNPTPPAELMFLCKRLQTALEPLLSSHVQFWNHHYTIMVDPDYPFTLRPESTEPVHRFGILNLRNGSEFFRAVRVVVRHCRVFRPLPDCFFFNLELSNNTDYSNNYINNSPS